MEQPGGREDERERIRSSLESKQWVEVHPIHAILWAPVWGRAVYLQILGRPRKFLRGDPMPEQICEHLDGVKLMLIVSALGTMHHVLTEGGSDSTLMVCDQYTACAIGSALTVQQGKRRFCDTGLVRPQLLRNRLTDCIVTRALDQTRDCALTACLPVLDCTPTGTVQCCKLTVHLTVK